MSIFASTGLVPVLNITSILSSCVFYRWLDNSCKIRYRRFGPRAISTIHAILTSFLGILCLKDILPDVYFMILVRWISTGYFFIDTITVIRELYQRVTVFNAMIIIHHIIAILLLSMFPIHLAHFTAHGFLTEMTTPFINICWYLRKTSRDTLYKSTFLYQFSGFCAWFLFLILRIVNYSVQMYIFLPEVSWSIRVCCISVWILNVLWFPKVTTSFLFP